jgi:hypothetical protein
MHINRSKREVVRPALLTEVDYRNTVARALHSYRHTEWSRYVNSSFYCLAKLFQKWYRLGLSTEIVHESL